MYEKPFENKSIMNILRTEEMHEQSSCYLQIKVIMIIKEKKVYGGNNDA